MRMQWTQERCEQLTRLWTAGMSSNGIANELGLTRGQILGKLHRLGLMGQGGAMRRAKGCVDPVIPVSGFVRRAAG
jgi:hypothetical protein